MSGTTQAKPVPWRLDLVLGLAVVLGPQAVLLALWWWMYYAGRTNQWPLRLEWYLGVGAVGFCIFAFVAQTVLKWRRVGWVSRLLRLLVLGWLLTGFVGLFAYRPLVGVWAAPMRPFVSEDMDFLHGLKKWVEERADFKAIREWAKAHPGWEDEHIQSAGPADKSRRPACVNVLDPAWVSVHEDSTGHIKWGGGFFHWGMVVYPEGKEAPEADYNELIIAPGVVLWDEP